MSINDPEHNDDRYYKLAEKFLNGSITAEEEKDFTEWYKGLEYRLPINIPASVAKNEIELKNRIHNEILQGLGRKKQRTISPWIRYGAVAAVLLLIGASAYLYLKPLDVKQYVVNQSVKKADPAVRPGDDRAVLTLGDGSEILLDNATNGALIQQGATKVIKLKKGQLVYKSSDDNSQVLPAVSYNTITTPRGGQYQIILPDNTSVWLNASSSLRFPTVFRGRERRVQLTGEGYFEVAQNKNMPFKVQVNEMEVSVLGTQFNVMAYNEGQQIETTLLTGSVKVTKGTSENLLKPGERASLKKSDNKFQISRHVNVKQVIAWKNGDFYFENTDIQAVMSQISRWYDVSVSYNGNIPDVGFSGIISRVKDISQILEILEATHLAHFKLEGHKIIVSAAMTKV